MKMYLLKFMRKYLTLLLIFTARFAVAYNDIHDGEILSGEDFSGSSYKNSSWVNCIAIGTIFSGYSSGSDYTSSDFTGTNLSSASFYYATVSGANFAGANLTDSFFYEVNLQNASFLASKVTGTDFSNSDLRGSDMSLIEGTPIYENTILSDGKIMNYTNGSLIIYEYKPTNVGGEMISAKFANDSIISAGAQLALYLGSEVEILNGATLTIANGSSIIINTDADSSTSFKVNSGGGLAFENGAILEINVVSDMSARDTLQIVIMDFDDGARIAGLDALIKDETIQLSVNGSKWLGEWDYALENNQMLITVAVPEPAVCAAAIGALSLLLAVRRRMR